MNRHTFPRAHVSQTCRHLIPVSVSLRSQMPWCAIFLSSQCWSDWANFSRQECHFGTAGTDEVSTWAAALCPALWYLASHSRPSTPCMVLSLSVISISRSRDESVFVDAVGTSNLCQLALPHMIMCCRVGSSPRRSCSASSTSPTTKGLLLRPKGASGQSHRQPNTTAQEARRDVVCRTWLAVSLLSLLRQTFVFVHSRILRFCGDVLVATSFLRRGFLKSGSSE